MKMKEFLFYTFNIIIIMFVKDYEKFVKDYEKLFFRIKVKVTFKTNSLVE